MSNIDLWVSIAATAAVIAVAETVLRLRWLAAWNARGFTTAHYRSVGHTAARSVTAATAAAAVYLSGYVWQAVVAAAMLTWLSVAVSVTDLADRRIPKEPCWAAVAAGTILGLSGFTQAGAASAVTAAAVTATIILLTIGVVVFVFKGAGGGIGSGDARLLIALSTGAWWFGFTPTLIGLLLASLIQVVLRFTLLRRYTKKPGGYPFAPALALGYAAAVALYSTPATVCAEWVYMLACPA